uniref:Uncharacterized protein n=1 Tax=Lotus japonicus TaxID=34305 RepID=I3T492_LOTJA|nr:unknown [Lotus japonicus]
MRQPQFQITLTNENLAIRANKFHHPRFVLNISVIFRNPHAIRPYFFPFAL